MKTLYKILDIARFALIAGVIGLMGYKYLNDDNFDIQTNSYLQTVIFVLIAVEAFRLFGPKKD